MKSKSESEGFLAYVMGSVRLFLFGLFAMPFFFSTAFAGPLLLTPAGGSQTFRYFYAQETPSGPRKILVVRAFCSPDDTYMQLQFERDPLHPEYNIDKIQAGHYTQSTECTHSPELFEKTFTFPNSSQGTQELVTFRLNPEPTAFDQEEAVQIKRLNELFQPAFSKEIGTYSFHHGRKTKKTVVFIHGLSLGSGYFREQALDAFYAGHNVLVANIPGHSNAQDMNKAGINVGLWYLYAEYLTRLARQYGDEVVLVGQSMGGHLAVRMAEDKLVDKIILVQPMLGLPELNKFAIKLANTGAASAIVDFGAPDSLKEYFKNFLAAAAQTKTLPLREYRKIPAPIEVLVYVSRYDYVVSNSSTQEWVKNFAPQAQVFHSKIAVGMKGHMSIPENILIQF